MTDTETKLRALVAEQLHRDPESITTASKFWDDLGADSLETVVLAVEVEDLFGVEFSDDEADAAFGPAGTFGDALKLVQGKLDAQVPA